MAEAAVRVALLARPGDARDQLRRALAELGADTAGLLDLIRPNETTIIDLRLTRVVREGVLRFTRQLAPRRFRDDAPGGPI